MTNFAKKHNQFIYTPSIFEYITLLNLFNQTFDTLTIDRSQNIWYENIKNI